MKKRIPLFAALAAWPLMNWLILVPYLPILRPYIEEAIKRVAE